MTAPVPTDQTEYSATIVRVFDAPCELVFQAWTNPKHVAQWWGPEGFTVPNCEIDLRSGGVFVADMQAPDGTVIPNKGVIREVGEPERLVIYTSAIEDENGEPMLEGVSTITFEDHEGKTKLTLHAVLTKVAPAVVEAAAGMETGWSQSFDKLANYLATIR